MISFECIIAYCLSEKKITMQAFTNLILETLIFRNHKKMSIYEKNYINYDKNCKYVNRF